MLKALRVQKYSQAEIFASPEVWTNSCLLQQITPERCDYIERCVDKVFGREALRQQQVLEIGCGGGMICQELAHRGAEMVGLDPSAGALQAARERIQKAGLGNSVHFDQGCAESLPYADGSFSVIVCLDVLEHVSDLPKTIWEIARVLAPGGIFIFDTINRTWLARLILIWIGERFFQRWGLWPGLHDYHSFIKPRELRALIRATHLQVREMTGFMPSLSKGRLTLGSGWFMGVSYVGYATKGRAAQIGQ
ncbi:3-demethylubiquinone-9 3-O-methyltransferase [Ktedonosporobacter rubrisoli]|uniref:3-demethylubiquinone-9 3-O-methyltransferase n=1 Tax=Ktedonosporobacter rubrisoli TaxID=2509675 RepID=A0A4V0YZR5_KTERU|nr:bifunctional 2-polyprenyl-6-hydroxyphenol methylase/3-demethylubiquinol 3-O-methyltransferase UbiG [Ktedonosporobacter rubrisoli]QBD80641.1 3-demethylubiquinone-9 3-O-methyltransferase [Ktedonosporobacter rubrisoli]